MKYCIAVFCRKIVSIGDAIITKERLIQVPVKTLNKDYAISVATEKAEKEFPGFEIVYINSVVL